MSNYIKTTKYTFYSFLPIALFYQCKNVIHMFFIFNGLLQTIESIQTNSPLASIVPVVWVMSMGMIFELISDLRRYKNDKKVNGQLTNKMMMDSKGKIIFEKTPAAKLLVGDMIMLENDNVVAADCVVLSTDDALGQCYISTSNLDGEKNLKPKLAPAVTQAKLD
jgi:magnesium-transporting ATPase (P-type)